VVQGLWTASLWRVEQAVELGQPAVVTVVAVVALVV
jgi:hypothetical protein